MASSALPPIEDVLKDLKSLILSAPRNITAKELFKDYFEMTSVRLNPKSYKFRSEDDFLGAYPQFFYAVNVVKGQIHYAGISHNPSTNAVAQLVNNQKNSGRKANLCINGSSLQRSSTFNAGPNSSSSAATTPIKNSAYGAATSTDGSKPSYANFFKTPQPKLGQQPDYEPSVTVSVGSDVLSQAKLGRSHSVKGVKKSSSRIIPSSKPFYNSGIHKNSNNLHIKPLATNTTSKQYANGFNGNDLRSIIEGNKSYNNQLKTPTTNTHSMGYSATSNAAQNYSTTPNNNNNIISNNNSISKPAPHHHHKKENYNPSIDLKPTQKENNASPATTITDAENRELYEFVLSLRANVKKCLDLHCDRFCSLSQLQNDYIKLFHEPFHPPDMPRDDITNIFETYLGNVCMVLNSMKGVLYIKGLTSSDQ